MITKNHLNQYFLRYANCITTNEGVSIQVYGSSLIEVSVMLRNQQDYDVLLQFRTAYMIPEKFVETFNLQYLEDIKKISIENLMVLYKRGKVELSVMELPV